MMTPKQQTVAGYVVFALIGVIILTAYVTVMYAREQALFYR